MRESKGIVKFSLGGGLEGKLVFFLGGGGGGGGGEVLRCSSGTMGNLGIYQERVIYSLLTIPTLTLLLPSCLQSGLQQLFEECFPVKTVRVSSRYPVWLTPVIKTLLKKKP